MLIALAAALALSPTGGTTAQADTDTDRFTCRASLVRVTGEGDLAAAGSTEPVVANSGNDPCVADSATVAEATAFAEVNGERTTATVTSGSARTAPGADGATSEAGVADVVIAAPGAPVIQAEVLTSRASTTCADGQPVLSGTSQVLRVTVGSTTLSVPSSPASQTIPGVGTLAFNQQTVSSSSGPGGVEDTLTQRALVLDTAAADVVVGETVADFRGNPCAQPA